MPEPGRLDEEVALSRRWRPVLMSYFLRRVGHHAEAEDLTQEVFVRMLGMSDVATRSAEAYIFQMAANLLRDRARRSRVRLDHHDAVSLASRDAVEELDPHRLLASRAEWEIMARTLAALPERVRTSFVLYRMENLSLDAVAQLSGVSKSAVKKHVAKATAALMAKLRDAT